MTSTRLRIYAITPLDVVIAMLATPWIWSRWTRAKLREAEERLNDLVKNHEVALEEHIRTSRVP